MKNTMLLDCTLRDGGFVNDWEFGRDDIVNIFERSASAGTDIIEIGFLDERREYDPNRTIMPDALSVNKAFSGLYRGDSMIVGMIDFGTCSVERLIPCSESIMDGIRVIFKKKNRYEALELCRRIKELGYEVFVQPVSITGYSDEEMLELIELVNELSPTAMSMVDTYGLLHEGGLLHYYELMDGNLDSHISIGYHAHNNFQLGYSNSIALIERNLSRGTRFRRTLVVDGSAFGMGKGAGNAPLELLAMYMNRHELGSYDINQLLEIIDVSVMNIYLKSPWGYSLKYFLAASNDCHPNYVQHLMQKRTLSVRSINELLSSIEPSEKLAYNADHIEEIYQASLRRIRGERGDLDALAAELGRGPLLIMGPARSMEDERETINAIIAQNRPVTLTVNYLPEKYYTDFIFISNSKRYVSLEGRLEEKRRSGGALPVLIATSNVTRARGNFDVQVDYESLLDPSFEFRDSALIMLLKLLIRLGIREVYLAGFDGYTTSPGENYFNIAMEYAFVKDKAQLLNEYMKSALSKLSGEIDLHFITRTRYV